jgi:hypothetical protein
VHTHLRILGQADLMATEGCFRDMMSAEDPLPV